MHGKRKGGKNSGSSKKSSEVNKVTELPDQNAENNDNLKEDNTDSEPMITSRGKRTGDNVDEIPEKKKRDRKEPEKIEESETSDSLRRTKRAVANNIANSGSEKKMREIKTPKKVTQHSKEDEEKKTKSREYEVEAIVDQRKKKGSEEFLIKWKGYSETENTWEPKSNLNCKRLLDDFLKNKK